MRTVSCQGVWVAASLRSLLKMETLLCSGPDLPVTQHLPSAASLNPRHVLVGQGGQGRAGWEGAGWLHRLPEAPPPGTCWAHPAHRHAPSLPLDTRTRQPQPRPPRPAPGSSGSGCLHRPAAEQVPTDGFWMKE